MRERERSPFSILQFAGILARSDLNWREQAGVDVYDDPFPSPWQDLADGQVPDGTRHVSAVGRERGRVAASFPRANHVRS